MKLCRKVILAVVVAVGLLGLLAVPAAQSATLSQMAYNTAKVVVGTPFAHGPNVQLNIGVKWNRDLEVPPFPRGVINDCTDVPPTAPGVWQFRPHQIRYALCGSLGTTVLGAPIPSSVPYRPYYRNAINLARKMMARTAHVRLQYKAMRWVQVVGGGVLNPSAPLRTMQIGYRCGHSHSKRRLHYATLHINDDGSEVLAREWCDRRLSKPESLTSPL